jgi:hypothetical protein
MTKESATMPEPSLPIARPLPRRPRALLVSLLAATALGLALGPAPALADFGIAGFDGSVADQSGDPFTQAGGHPYQASTTIDFNTTFDNSGQTIPDGNVKDIRVDLPPGLVGDPSATPKCSAADLEVSTHSDEQIPNCPADTQVGVLILTAFSEELTFGVYNMEAPAGDPARFGAHIIFADQYFDAHVRTGSDYGLAVTLDNISTLLPFTASTVTLWGVPADPSHDAQRFCPGTRDTGCSAGGALKPFLTLPTSCAGPQTTTLHTDSWQAPGDVKSASFVSHDNATPPNPIGADGCQNVPFDPSFSADPTSNNSGSPSGLDFDLQVPQDGLTDPNGIATSHLRKAVVTLPQGMTVNPASADGLAACTPAQIGLTTPDPAACPDASKLGTAEITTPLLDHPVEGSVYLASQSSFQGSLLALYIAADDPASGVVLKLPGTIAPDPNTGRLTATFDNQPQLPFSDLQLHFKSGDRAPLANPPTCGIYTTHAQLTPWSGNAPSELDDSFVVDHAPDGGPCLAGDPSQPGDPADRADLPFAPKMTAGTQRPLAGSYSPFVLRLQRSDGDQEITRLDATLPPGVLGKLAGVSQCPDATLSSIPSASGTGAAEKASPSCPANSKVGTTQVGAGVGPTPDYIPGNVYLAGPYKGAPLSLAIVTPAVAGPFDLGNVVIRTALFVDPSDAHLHAVSDPIPTILDGIPLHIRDVRVVMDRPNFTLNPTNCNAMQVTGTVNGAGGVLNNSADDVSAPVSDHFQVAGCGTLGFSPKLSGQILNGKQGIHHSDHPNLRFNLAGRQGDANMASVSVLLPQAFQIDQANLGNICSETQLANEECAGRNAVGTASATTPILDIPLSGPVYAVSGSGGLPKLAVILHGPPQMPIKLVIRGITDTVGARIRNTFPLVPDAPVTDFALTLNGGPAGYLVNNTNVCGSAKGKSKKAKKKANRLRKTNLTANASYTAQDGDTLSQRVPIAAQCPKAKKNNRHAKHKKH